MHLAHPGEKTDKANNLNGSIVFWSILPKKSEQSCKMGIFCRVQPTASFSLSPSCSLSPSISHISLSLSLSVSSYYPNPSPAVTLHHYLPLIFPLLPSLSLFALPFLLSLTCISLPLPSSLPSDAFLGISLEFSTGQVNKPAWFHQCESVSLIRRDPDGISSSFDTAIHHDHVAT